MGSFSSAPTLEFEGATPNNEAQLEMAGEVHVGNPKEEKTEVLNRASEIMSSLGGVASSQDVEELRPKTIDQRFDELSDKVGSTISTKMNTAIGHDLQAKDAKVVADILIDSKNKARIAVELANYEKGSLSEEDLSEEAKEELSAGGSSSKVMLEAEMIASKGLLTNKEQSDALNFDKNLSEARNAYADALSRGKGILPSERAKRKEELEIAERAYNEAFVQRISDIMGMNPSHRKAPYVTDVMKGLSEEVTFEGLAGNHLHILADSIVREQLAKSKALEARSSVGVKKVLKAFKTNRALRVVVGGAIWGASMAAANKGLLPAPLEGAGSVFEKVLPLVAGYVTSREVMAGVEEGVTGFKDRREQRERLEELSTNSRLGEAALRTIYSNIEYEGIGEREVGDNAEETKKVFGMINTQFDELEQSGSRGGKPYTAEQILPIVSDLYLERKDQIDGIVESNDPAEAFKKLCAEVISADSERLTKKVYLDRKKTAILRSLSVASSIFVSQFIGLASDLQGASVKPIDWTEKA